MPDLTTPGGLRLYYERWGDPAHPTVLLVMGIGAQLVLWPQELIDNLVQRGFFVVAFDNRDVGRSEWLDDAPVQPALPLMARALAGLPIQSAYTLYDLASDAVGLLDGLGVEAAHVVGVSMGGMVAQCIAIQHPDRVLSLTSMHSTTGSRLHSIGQPRAYRALLGPSPRTRQEAGQRFVDLYKVIGSPGFALDWAELRARGELSFDRGVNPKGFLRQWAAILATGSRDRALVAVACPTLVLHGAEDPLVPVRAARHTQRCVGENAELVVIDGLGHDMPAAVRGRIAEHIHWNARRAG